MKILVAVIACLTSVFASFVNAGYEEDVALINKGMPKQVKLFNQRQIECNHWAGEEPYDKQRANEINAAITKQRCGDLDMDEKRLRKKYKTRPNVIDSINKAKAFI